MKLKPKEIAQLLKAVIAGESIPAVYLWGPPGVGKSRICKDVAEEEKVEFIDMRLSMKDPTDIKGLPTVQDGKARWLPPSEFPTQGRGILLLDEMNLASPLTQAAAYQLILDRRVGEYVLPDGWHIIAAGNKAEHGANVFKMAAPLRNRFIHIEFELDVDNWREWALNNNVASEVIEFISFRPDLLFAFDQERHDNAFPTPRSWEFVSQILNGLKDIGQELQHKVIEGTVGIGAALEFKAYLSIKKELPDVDEILAGKNHIPRQIDIACALVTALVVRAQNNQFERLLAYSKSLDSKEVATLMLKLMAQKNKAALLACPSWKELANEYFGLII